MTHAVARLRAERLARSLKPFIARGSRQVRCLACRVIASHCFCTWRPQVESSVAMCLLMHDVEALKPSNTGWLIADVVSDTHAYGWLRTEVEAGLVALLQDPRYAPCVVFPGEYAAPSRVVEEVPPRDGRIPLFILLDATWTEARKMFRKSPYLDHLPVLSLRPEQLSRYRLRRSRRDDHLCTAEVAALCLELAGENRAATALGAWFDLFSERYLGAKQQRPVDESSASIQTLRALR